MDYAGTFPFGWLKDTEDSNWQILWNKNTGDFFIKSVKFKEIRKLNNFKNWKDAKNFADKIGTDPSILFK